MPDVVIERMAAEFEHPRGAGTAWEVSRGVVVDASADLCASFAPRFTFDLCYKYIWYFYD